MTPDLAARIYVQLGQRIKERRVTSGLTQEQLGNAVGISRPSISNIEAGRQPIQVDMLYRFASALEVELEDLLPEEQVRSDLPGLDGLPEEDEQFVRSLIKDAGDEMRETADA